MVFIKTNKYEDKQKKFSRTIPERHTKGAVILTVKTASLATGSSINVNAILDWTRFPSKQLDIHG